MKNKPYIYISLIALSMVILTSCSTPVESTQSVSTKEVPDMKVVGTDAPLAPPTEDTAPKQPEELPPIPDVQFGPGQDWFRPTPPGEIQLASGGVQLFEFSAVW